MYLITPLKNTDVKKLRTGDIVYISGMVYTARDRAHRKALEEGMFPGNIEGGVLFHSGLLQKREKRMGGDSNRPHHKFEDEPIRA